MHSVHIEVWIMTDAYVNVMVEPGAVQEAATAIAERDSVSSVHLVTGEVDLVVQLDLPSKDDIARVVTEDIHSVSGVFDTETSVAFDP